MSSSFTIMLDVPIETELGLVDRLCFPVPLRFKHLRHLLLGEKLSLEEKFIGIIVRATGLDESIIDEISAADIAKVVEHLEPQLASLQPIAKNGLY